MTKVTLNNVGSLIDATTAAATINANFNTIETAFDNTYSRDGSTPNTASAALDMNSNQIYNLPAPSTVNSPARLIDVTSNPTIVVPGTGTSGHVVPFLDGNNTFSGTNTFSTVPAFPANSIPNAKLATMAANTVKGSIAGGTPSDLTTTQVTTLVNPVTSTLSGAAPASGGGSTNFLRADATWAVPTATWTLLELLTANNSAAVQSTVSWTPYSQIEVVFFNLTPAVSTQTLLLQVHSGGIYQTLNYSTAYNVWTSSVTAQGSTTTGIPLCQSNLSNSGSGISGRIRGMNINSSASTKHWLGEAVGVNSTPLFAGIHVVGIWTGASTALDGCQIIMSSGNITSGFVKIYGII